MDTNNVKLLRIIVSNDKKNSENVIISLCALQ